jgi:hypothetical protein
MPLSADGYIYTWDAANNCGTWKAPSGTLTTASFGAPSVAVKLTAADGVATTALRSDAQLALDQSIAPTMTGAWVFTSTVKIQKSNPAFELNNTAAGGKDWLWRAGGAGAGILDIYDATDAKTMLAVVGSSEVRIGTATNAGGLGNASRLFVFGGSNGANIDVMGDGAVSDQATIELEGSDYSTNLKSVRLQYYGVNGLGTSFGVANQNLGMLCWQGASSALIATDNSTPIRLIVNSSEVGRWGSGLMIGTTTDPGAGIVNALTGYRVANAATSGNVLRGNGTNFVSAQLQAADVGGGAALTRVNDTNVTLTLGGSPTVALLAATSLTLGWTGLLSLSRGGTGADLSATGGTSQVLKQTSAGGVVTVSQLAASDLSNGVTGSGAVVLTTSAVLVTPNLGTPSAGTLTNCTGLPITTGVSGLASGVATFLATPSSANLAAAVTDETGTGALVFATSPTLVTPTLGVATATTVNKVTITAPATGSTLTIADAKTLTVSNSITLAGADGKSLTLTGALTVGADTTVSGGGTLSLGGFTLTVPATGTAVLTSRTITEGAGLAGNTYDLSANRTLALGTPSTLTTSTTNSASGTTHTHAVTSSSNPGAAASLLATDASGFLTLARLTSTGYLFVNNASASLYLKDTSTGLLAATTQLVTMQSGNSFRSASFTSGLQGWSINDGGDAEFANVTVRGAIRSSVLLYNAVLATNGSQIITKAAAKLKADVAVPASPTYGTTTVTIDVVDQDGLTHAASQLFVVNDILRLKDGIAGDTWFKVTAVSDQTTFWRYTASIQAGTNNITYRAGLGVLNYGQSGAGFIIETADQSNAPYIQMATHAASFTAANSSGTLSLTPQLRIGNLNGSYDYAADTYGFGAGQYASGKSWLTVDQTNGIRIGNGTTVLGQWDTSGNLTLGQLATNSGNAFWNNSNKHLEFRGGSGGTQVQAYIDTTGAFVAGGGAIILDANGLRANASFAGSLSALTSYAVVDAGGHNIFVAGAYYDSSTVHAYVNTHYDDSGRNSRLDFISQAQTANKTAVLALSTVSTTYLTTSVFLNADSNGNYVWTNCGLNVGGSTFPSSGFMLDVIGATRVLKTGVGTTSTDGLLLTNTTSAANNSQQYSPRLHFTGQGWKTNATAASQTVDFIEEVRPVQGAASPTGNLVWAAQVNAGGYSDLMTLTSGGNLGIGTTSPGDLLHVNGSVKAGVGGLQLVRGTGTLANGQNNNVSLPANVSYVTFTGPTAAYSVTGFANPYDGRMLIIYFNIGQTLTIKHDNSGSTSGQRITVAGGADITFAAGAAVRCIFVYDQSVGAGVGYWVLYSAEDGVR